MYPDFSCCLHVVSISISTWNTLKYEVKELKLIALINWFRNKLFVIKKGILIVIKTVNWYVINPHHCDVNMMAFNVNKAIKSIENQ